MFFFDILRPCDHESTADTSSRKVMAVSMISAEVMLIMSLSWPNPEPPKPRTPRPQAPSPNPKTTAKTEEPARITCDMRTDTQRLDRVLSSDFLVFADVEGFGRGVRVTKFNCKAYAAALGMTIT